MLLVANTVARGGGPEGGGFFIFPLLLMLLFGFLLFRLIRRGRGPGMYSMHPASPAGILGQRFARGEIDRAEYEYRRAILNKDKDVPSPPAFMAPPMANPGTDSPATPKPSSRAGDTAAETSTGFDSATDDTAEDS